jgi:hypothetical protein
MRPGYGLRIRRSGRQNYLYLWHYEDRGRRRVKREVYLGSTRDPTTRQRALEALEEHHARLVGALHRYRERMRRTVERLPRER